jgi:hypothetical protein
MIKGLASGVGVTVSGGNTSVPYVNQNTTNPIQGMIRVWGTDMQVFDGTNWVTISTSYATVELNTETKMLLEWAKKKKIEEELLITLPSDHPSVKAAKQNLNKAKLEVNRLEEQLKITEILIQDEQTAS